MIEFSPSRIEALSFEFALLEEDCCLAIIILYIGMELNSSGRIVG